MSFYKIMVVIEQITQEHVSEIKRRVGEAVKPHRVIDISSYKYRNLAYVIETYDLERRRT